MKKVKLIAGLLTALLILPIFGAGVNVMANEIPSTISVSGSGAVSVAPDVAIIHLGVNTDGERPIEILATNNILVAAVNQAIIAAGVDEDDIATSRFNLSPIFDHTMGWQSDVVGFRVSNNITVTTTDFDIIADVLGAAIEAGANVSSGVSFGILDSNQAYNQALELAVQNATAKARVIASALGTEIAGSQSGINIVGVQSITESWSTHMPMTRQLQAGQLFAESSMDMSTPGVFIASNNIEVVANVTVVYIIE